MKHKLLLPLFLLLGFSSAKAQFSGNALDFDGSNDMVVCSTVPTLFSNIATNDFTIEAWVNPRSATFSRIFFAQASTTNFATVSLSTGYVIYFYVVKNGTTYSVATSAGLTANAWTHVAARWTASTNSVAVYFNGVLQTGVAGGTSSTGTNGLMTLGTRPGGAQYFTGGIDELRVWNEARTTCQIQNNMNNSITGAQTNLVVNYNFNQGVAAGNNTGTTTLPDISGNSFNGTLTNFTLTSTTSNWITSAATVTASGNPLGGVSVSQSANICSGGNFTFPDGTTQTNITSQVAHASHLFTAAGCDSIINTTVLISPTYSLTASANICSGGNFTFPDGTTQTNITSQVVHTSSLTASTGCDSTITTTVFISPTYAVSESANLCYSGSYTFPDGTTMNNITAQVVHTSNLQAVTGCDSIVTTTVNVNPIYALSEAATICSGSSYTFPDGSSQTITSQTVHTSMLTSSAGCDSTITTTVDVNPSYASSVTDSVCSGSSYSFPDGSSQTITGQVTQISTLQTVLGCDSIITSNIDIIHVRDSVIQTGFTLMAYESGATYQWLDCNNGYAMISGETSQTFAPTVGGNYAVTLTLNGCTDTSACFEVPLGVHEITNPMQVDVYPNPANNLIYVTIDQNTEGTIELFDLTGAVVRTQSFNGTRCTLDLTSLAKGFYSLSIRTPEGRVMKQVVKE